MHVTLLGDSIFDNSAYIAPEQPDVVTQLQKLIPKATLRAIDGNVIADVSHQIVSLPEDTTHLVISVGGNDCLIASSILMDSARSVADGLLQLDSVIQEFKSDYRSMLGSVLSLNLPVIICTIYEPKYPDQSLQQVTITALKLFNDIILSAAIQEQIPVIDLRVVCSKLEDFANPIEPSMIGGGKIADCIARAIAKHNFSDRKCTIYT